jgi:hypothetical protein
MRPLALTVRKEATAPITSRLVLWARGLLQGLAVGARDCIYPSAVRAGSYPTLAIFLQKDTLYHGRKR